MSIFVIIGIFGVLYGSAYILSRHPDWRATRVLFSFRGPLPKHGETFVHFTLRWARFSALIAAGLGAVVALVVFVDIPNYALPGYLEQGTLFICALGFLLCAVGSIGVLLKAIWYALFVRELVFDEASRLFA